MTTKYLFVSLAVCAACMAVIVVEPVFFSLLGVIVGGVVLHVFSSMCNGILSAKRILVGYYSVLIVAAPFLISYGNSLSSPLSNLDWIFFGQLLLATGIGFAFAYRIAEMTLGRLNIREDYKE